MKSILTDKMGYTLVELMVNLGIIAILAAISVPTYLTYRETAKIGRARAELKNIHLAVEALAADTEKWPGPNTIGQTANQEIWDLTSSATGLISATSAFKNRQAPIFSPSP